MHQPFVEYRGQIASPDGKTRSEWDILIDRCKAAPKVAVVSGGIPAFKCPAPGGGFSGGFVGYDAAMFSFLGHELQIHGGSFSASGLQAGRGDGDAYSLTGTVTGTVNIPKRGPGSGHSTIAGKLTDESFCPGHPLSYKVRFARTWSYVGSGQGS